MARSRGSWSPPPGWWPRWVRVNADGSFVVRAPCGGEMTVSGEPITGAHVVLDPGHGGEEPGAVGPAGTLEKTVNLAIAEETQRQLEDLGATVVLTRTGDYRITLASRAAIATSLRPRLFVSITTTPNPTSRGTPPERRRTSRWRPRSPSAPPASCTRSSSAPSRPTTSRGWPTGTPAPSTASEPTAPTTTASSTVQPGFPGASEAAFISNPPEEALLADAAFQRVEATALVEAIVRFVTTDDPGSGYVTPYPRTQPAGPGGGNQGCQDPTME